MNRFFKRLLVALNLAALGSASLAQVTQNTTTQYAHDAQGNLTTITDPRGLVTTRGFDALNRLIQIVQPPATTGAANETTAIGYDGRGQITSVTDPRSLLTQYTVDGLGNATAQLSPDSGSTTRVFDAAGNLVSSTDARGKKTTFTYDALNRLTSIAYATGTATVLTYDGGSAPLPFDVGHLTTIADESGSTRLQFDAFGHIIIKTQISSGTGATAVSQAVQYVYGTGGATNGKLINVVYPSGAVLGYGFDQAGRISSIVVTRAVGGNTAVSSALVSNITYSSFGQPNSWIWGNGTPYSRTFDLGGRLTQYPIGAVAGSSPTPNSLIRTVDYDPASRITAYIHSDASGNLNNMVAVAANQSFAFDNLNRITSYSPAGTDLQYTYDASGNRTSLTVGTTTYTDTIDPLSNRLLGTNGPAPAKTNTYDAAGNLTFDGTVTYAYSDRGRLASSQTAAATVSYLYNGMGQRTLKIGPASVVPTGVNRYVYDEAGHLIGEYDSGGNLIQETAFLGDTPVAVLQTR
jgi:YD repeat-containing protein